MEHSPQRSSQAAKILVALVALGGLMSLGLGLWLYVSFFRVAREERTALRDTSQVVAAVRDLSSLETVAFHMERVIDLREKSSQLFGLVQAEDAILLVAAADVVAGIDLSTMAEGDIQLEPERRSVHIFLPPPRILSARLDNQRTYVHTRSTDTLAKRSEELETKARQTAEHVLRDAAIQAGIIERARRSGEVSIARLLRGLGFIEVQVQFREE